MKPGGERFLEEPPAPEAAVFSPLRILLAEDDPVNQLAGKRLLERQGHAVVCAGTGRQAIELLAGDRFDVILMDIQMPDMDGLEATREIREGRAGAGVARIPIIALTAYAMIGDKEKFLAAGMNGYLAKPIELAELIAVLARAAAKG